MYKVTIVELNHEASERALFDTFRFIFKEGVRTEPRYYLLDMLKFSRISLLTESRRLAEEFEFLNEIKASINLFGLEVVPAEEYFKDLIISRDPWEDFFKKYFGKPDLEVIKANPYASEVGSHIIFEDEKEKTLNFFAEKYHKYTIEKLKKYCDFVKEKIRLYPFSPSHKEVAALEKSMNAENFEENLWKMMTICNEAFFSNTLKALKWAEDNGIPEPHAVVDCGLGHIKTHKRGGFTYIGIEKLFKNSELVEKTLEKKVDLEVKVHELPTRTMPEEGLVI